MEEPEKVVAELEEKHVSSNVCETCLSDNLLKEIGIRSCNRCKQAFCIHFSSNVDSQYCVDCMSDISVTVNNITKTYERERYDAVTDDIKVVRYSQRGRQIIIDGQDWLFAQRKNKTKSDVELAMSIEYHQTMFRLLVAEAEERKIAKMHRNMGVKIQSAAPSSVTSTVTTTTSKSTQTKSTKAQAQMSALIQAMLAKGMTMDQIMGMLKGK